jgi:hypothetical protein
VTEQEITILQALCGARHTGGRRLDCSARCRLRGQSCLTAVRSSPS